MGNRKVKLRLGVVIFDMRKWVDYACAKTATKPGCDFWIMSQRMDTWVSGPEKPPKCPKIIPDMEPGKPYVLPD